MKNISEPLIKTLAIGVSCGIFGLFLGAFKELNQTIELKKNSRKFIEENLEEIVKDQEKRLGIKHFGLPKITYDLFSTHTGGSYNPENDKMTLSVSTINSDNLYFINHELGHFYADKLNESLGFGSWPDLKATDEKWKRLQLINEGIAEYFARTTTNKSEDYQSESSDANWRELYNQAFKFVKPIIQNYGKEGIEYLITRAATEKDIADPNLSQEKAIQELSIKSK